MSVCMYHRIRMSTVHRSRTKARRNLVPPPRRVVSSKILRPPLIFDGLFLHPRGLSASYRVYPKDQRCFDTEPDDNSCELDLTEMEAFRERHAVYLLCKEIAIIFFGPQEDHWIRSSSDLAMLFVAVSYSLLAHMLVSSRYRSHVPSIEEGFLTIDRAFNLFTQRVSSHPKDDIVIWSLRLNNKVFNTAKEFWRNKKHDRLATSFLLSTAPRLRIRGLG